MVNVNTPILNLPVVVSMTGAEAIPLVQGGVTKYATAQQIANTGTAFISSARTVTAGVGLTGGGALTHDIALSFDPSTLAPVTAMAVTDSFVISSGSTPETVTFPFAMKAINGLTVSPALNLANDKLIVYRAADGLVYYTTPSAIGTAVGNVPAGGTTGQVLSKLSSTNYDTAWTTLTGISGTLGATSNMVPRASGTGGQTIKAGNFINDDSGNVYPSSSGVGSLGLTTNMWSNLFLASGGVINWNNGNVTATHSANALAFAGASSGYSFDNTIKQTKGGSAAIVWQNIDGSVGLNMKTQLDTVGRYYEFWLDADGSGYSAAPTLSLTENVVKISSLVNIIASGANPAVTMWDTSSSGWMMFSQSGTLRFGNVNSSGSLQANRIDLTTTALAPSTTGGLTLGTTSLMWSDLFLKSGGTINWNNGNVTITHSAAQLDMVGTANIFSQRQGTFVGYDTGINPVTEAVYNGRILTVRANTNSGQHWNLTRSGAYVWSVGYEYNANNFAIGVAQGTDSSFTGSAIKLKIDSVTFAVTPGASGGAPLGNATLPWSDLFLKSGGTINFNNGNVTITHSAGALTQTGNLVVGGTISAGTAGSVVGDVIHYNATSGSITLRPVTGALGSSVLTLPAATDTIAVLAASQAFTNKTYNGLTITSSTGTLTVTNGKTLSISNTLTLAGTDSTTMTFPALSSNVLTTGNNATITVGYNVSPKLIGTVSSGTTTLVVADGNYQMVINGGAFSLSPPAATNFDAIDLLVINGPSAGAITFTAGKWRVGASTGSTFATTVRATATITVTIASPGVVSWTAHGCVEGDPVWFTTSGALPTGITASTVYYVKYVDANSFQLATTPGGSAINTSGSQSGTHTGNAASQFVLSVRQIYGSATYSWYALQ